MNAEELKFHLNNLFAYYGVLSLSEQTTEVAQASLETLREIESCLASIEPELEAGTLDIRTLLDVRTRIASLESAQLEASL